MPGDRKDDSTELARVDDSTLLPPVTEAESLLCAGKEEGGILGFRKDDDPGIMRKDESETSPPMSAVRLLL